MDLSKYINALKEIPKRFGNVSYHYWDKQVSDNVVGAFNSIQNYSTGTDNAVRSLGNSINNINNTIANFKVKNIELIDITEYMPTQFVPLSTLVTASDWTACQTLGYFASTVPANIIPLSAVFSFDSTSGTKDHYVLPLSKVVYNNTDFYAYTMDSAVYNLYSQSGGSSIITFYGLKITT